MSYSHKGNYWSCISCNANILFDWFKLCQGISKGAKRCINKGEQEEFFFVLLDFNSPDLSHGMCEKC